jgi:hypothetical protein
MHNVSEFRHSVRVAWQHSTEAPKITGMCGCCCRVPLQTVMNLCVLLLLLLFGKKNNVDAQNIYECWMRIINENKMGFLCLV